ncbi:TatD family hydrolase, partial [bacterium]|nr:TatD family hydrolase [bacterium]
SAGPEVALAYAELGFSIAVGGLATFPKTDEIRAAAGAVPLERLLLETDCPFMAPVPHRGKRCEPAFIADTCSAVAKVRGISPEDLARATSENAARLFAISLTID